MQCWRAAARSWGVIPESLESLEVAHRELTEKVVTEDMFRRKQIMMDRADAFAVLPGGFGSLDEFFEVLTWKQLGLHDKPVVVLDSEGYWGPLLDLLDHVSAEGFAPQAHEQTRHGGAVHGRAVPLARQRQSLRERREGPTTAGNLDRSDRFAKVRAAPLAARSPVLGPLSTTHSWRYSDGENQGRQPCRRDRRRRDGRGSSGPGSRTS